MDNLPTLETSESTKVAPRAISADTQETTEAIGILRAMIEKVMPVKISNKLCENLRIPYE
jgi:hypothetical protein